MQLIKMLNDAKGNGTSMISLILPPKSQVRLVLVFRLSFLPPSTFPLTHHTP